MGNNPLNVTDDENTLLSIVLLQSLKIGKNIRQRIKSGELLPCKNEALEVMINFFDELDLEYPLYAQVLAKLDSPECQTMGNFGLAPGGCCLAGLSGMNYAKTNSRLARICYGASMVCSKTATVAGTVSGFGHGCGISTVAMLSDTFGGAFLFLGNRAQDVGLWVDKKPKFQNPFRRRSSLGFHKGVSFISPG